VNPAVVEGLVEAAVLLLLAEQDSYGYELSRALRRSQLIPDKTQSARIYEVLQQLETDGAVGSGKQVGPNGPDRRCYTLTSSGLARLQRWAEALRLTETHLTTFLTIYLAYNTRRKEVNDMGCTCACCGGDNTREQQIEEQERARAEREKQARQARIAHLEAELKALKNEA